MAIKPDSRAKMKSMDVPFSGPFGFQVPLAITPAGQSSNGSADWFPPVDIFEDSKEYLLKMDLPDVQPEELHVFVEEDSLVISGERPSEPLAGKQSLRVERPRGRFERRFTLPDNASRADIEPLFRACILEVHLRKTDTSTATPITSTGEPKLRLRPDPCSA